MTGMNGHRGGSSDPAVQFVEQMVDDLVEPIAQRTGLHSGPRGDGDRTQAPAHRASFVPVFPLPAIVSVGAIESDQISSWVSEHGGDLPAVDHVLVALTELSSWSSVAVTATAGALVLDGLRWTAFRHRRAITNQVRAITSIAPKRVWVRWPAGIAAPRHVIVKLPAGSVILDKRYDVFRDAVTKYANRHRGNRLLTRGEWILDVEWQAGSDRLIITRRRPVEALAGTSDRHKRLASLLDEKFPLPGAHITAVERDENGSEIGYAISYTPTIVAALPAFQQRLRDALIGSLPPHESNRNWSVAVHSESDVVRVGLTDPLPTGAVNHTPLTLDQYRALDEKQLHTIPFAVGAAGKNGVWNIGRSSNKPHILMAGKTGGGKTSLIRTLLTDVIPRGVPVVGAIDVKRIELNGFESFPGVASVVYNIAEIVALVEAVYAEMFARYEFIHRMHINESELPLFVLVLDEFFVMSAFLRRAQSYKGKEPEAMMLAELVKNANPLGKIGEMLALIRSAGGRVALGVQRPDAGNFGDDATSVRDNFGSRVTLSNLSQQGALMMWDSADVGRDVDDSFPGRATVADEHGNPMHAQVLWTPNVDDHPNRQAKLSEADRQLVAQLRQAAIDGEQLAGDFLPEIREHLERIDGVVPCPAGGPPMACFSPELRDFLRDRHNQAPQQPSPIAGVDPTTSGDEGTQAGKLTSGDRIHIDQDGRTIVASVVSVRSGKNRVTVKLRDEDNPRRTYDAEYAPDEYLLTTDATEESLNAVTTS